MDGRGGEFNTMMFIKDLEKYNNKKESFGLTTEIYSCVDMAKFACFLGVKEGEVYERLEDYLKTQT